MRPKQESGSLARGACKAAQYKADASCSYIRTARTRRSNLSGSCLGVHIGAVVGASGETSLLGLFEGATQLARRNEHAVRWRHHLTARPAPGGAGARPRRRNQAATPDLVPRMG